MPMTEQEIQEFVKQIFPDQEIRVKIKNLHPYYSASVGCSGCVRVGDAPPEIYIAPGDAELSKPITLAILLHEIGHLHHHPALQLYPLGIHLSLLPKEECHKQEYEADRFAATTLRKIGFSSAQVLESFQNILNEYSKHDYIILSEGPYHPSWADRIEKVRAFLEAENEVPSLPETTP